MNLRQRKRKSTQMSSNGSFKNKNSKKRDPEIELRSQKQLRSSKRKSLSNPVEVKNRIKTKDPQRTPVNQNQTKENRTTQTSQTKKLDLTYNDLYTDPNFPSAYSAGLKRFLLEKESLSRHKPIYKTFKRRRVFVSGPYTLIQADLIHYRQYSRYNKGYKYILAVVDCFSRKNWCRPLSSATAQETASALDDIIQKMPFYPRQFASDKGSEFSPKNKEIFEILVEKYGMLIFQLKAPKKASIVERFIRTLKTRLARYFTENNTFKWYDVLDKISEGINNSINRSIKMTPNSVNFDNREEVKRNLYGSRALPPVCRFANNDTVRIPTDKNIFTKGYALNWSKELYQVSEVLNDGEVCYYKVKNSEGQELDRNFYDQELNLVIKNGSVPLS